MLMNTAVRVRITLRASTYGPAGGPMAASRQSKSETGRMRNAFTLMELIVVLVLIAIMAAVIVPEMKGSFEDALLRSNARKLADVFNLTYSRAVSLNRVHRVRLDPSTGHYFVEKEAAADGQAKNEFEPVTDVSDVEGEIDRR